MWGPRPETTWALYAQKTQCHVSNASGWISSLHVTPSSSPDTTTLLSSKVSTLSLSLSISSVLLLPVSISVSVSVHAMATLRYLALASPVCHCCRKQPRSLLGGVVSRSVHGSALSPFNGQSMQLPRVRLAPVRGNFKVTGPTITMTAKPTIQFIQGTDELTIPDVRLTKSRDGTNGTAIFSFEEPSVFDSTGEIADITGFYMIDEEGVLQSVDVSAKFINGKPSRIEAKYVMRSSREWDRFMRFMERYANQNDLQFMKKK